MKRHNIVACVLALAAAACKAASADQVAWDQFAAAAVPAGPARVAFETWPGDGAGAAVHAKSLRHGPFAQLRAAAGTRALGAGCKGTCFAEETRRLRGVEVQADWVDVATLIAWLGRGGVTMTAAQVRAQYYTAVSEGVSYALAALRISVPQPGGRVVASFEQQRNPGRCDAAGCSDAFGARQASVPARRGAREQQYGACAKSAALQDLFETHGLARVWNNYCLVRAQNV